MATNKEKLLPEKNFKWPENRVKALGVWISSDPSIMLNLNYIEKADKIRNVLNCWNYRGVTLIGKIQVIKSLAASELTYNLTPLPTNQKIVRKLNEIFYCLPWNIKGDKIKRTVLINDYNKGSLKMIDLCLFNKSLKTTWICMSTPIRPATTLFRTR